ncbi:hypothetical protein F7725_018139, partial [Dissostichus mawsoni]
MSQTEVDVRGPKDQRSSPCGNFLDRGERKVEEEEDQEEELGGEDCVILNEDYDTDLELREEAYDPTGYMEACEALQVVPAYNFLRNMHNSELSMMHRSLAVPLVTNTSILRLNLRDNWMEGMGGAAIAEMLKENCYITEVDLSDNSLGDHGAGAIASMLKENSTLVNLNLSGNYFTDRSVEHLGPALITNSRLQHLDLSHNALGEQAGQSLGHALSENTGLRSISLAWNCIRGRGAAILANGLGALKENTVLEELNVSNNRIPPEGAIHLAMGLKVNKTIKSLNMGKNPIQMLGALPSSSLYKKTQIQPWKQYTS